MGFDQELLLDKMISMGLETFPTLHDPESIPICLSQGATTKIIVRKNRLMTCKQRKLDI